MRARDPGPRTLRRHTAVYAVVLALLALVSWLGGGWGYLVLYGLVLGLFAIAAVLAPSYLAGRVLNYRDVRAARSYCMMLVPRIEAYREKEGAYPVHVRELLPGFREVPRLLSADGSFYQTVGARYEFVFEDPSGWERGHYYFSDEAAPRGRWETWN